jgi:histidine ammonia-lyase
MGMNMAIKNGQILDNACGVIGIEFIAAAQGLDFHEFTPGTGCRKAKAIVRKHAAHFDVENPLYSDYTKMKEVVKSCEILEEVEKAAGVLG